MFSQLAYLHFFFYLLRTFAYLRSSAQETLQNRRAIFNRLGFFSQSRSNPRGARDFFRAACRTSPLLLRALVSLIAEEYRFPCSLLFQAHMQARYVILRVLLEAGEKLVQLTSVTGSDGKPDVLISLDRTKIESVGRPAIGNFLRKLQVYHHLCDLGFL